MMHLQAIIERNKRPTPQPSRTDTTNADLDAYRALRFAEQRKRRPWDTPVPMTDAEAHPRLGGAGTTK